jgi:hypothetical protein
LKRAPIYCDNLLDVSEAHWAFEVPSHDYSLQCKTATLTMFFQSTNGASNFAKIKISDEPGSVFFVSFWNTVEPVVICASLWLVVHVILDEQSHCSQNCLNKVRYLNLATHNCLLHKGMMIKIATCSRVRPTLDLHKLRLVHKFTTSMRTRRYQIIHNFLFLWFLMRR